MSTGVSMSEQNEKVWVLLTLVDSDIETHAFRTCEGAVAYVKDVINEDWVQRDRNDKRTEEEMHQQQRAAEQNLVNKGWWRHAEYDMTEYVLEEVDLL